MHPKTLTLCFAALLASACLGQQGGQAGEPPAGAPVTATQQDSAPKLTPEQLAEIQKILEERALKQTEAIRRAELEGVQTRLGDIGRFRGARGNVLQGIGLIVGLNGTGDSKSTPWTSTLISNVLSRWGTAVDARQVQAKNIATVLVTAEMPAFVAPGTKIDVTVSSNGDAKSLEGGVLMPTVLTSMTDPDTVLATAYGSVSIGGFNASSGGSGVRKNHPNVGIVAAGATVERSVPTQILFQGGVMYFDLDTPDFSTAERATEALKSAYPELTVETVDGATIKLTLPQGKSPTEVAQRVELTQVFANTPASVVVNERTGTIVVGGNVRLGPAVIAHGSLEVRIATDYVVSQPAPFSNGETVVVAVPQVDAQESPAQTAVVAPTATLDDLAKILQTMRVTARDMIAILMALQKQGALKARIVVQ
ncbi:MAG: flagellar basal body P-ring protein FlgI [Fimbriimonadaceae bacterium]|nr:flagellar basal body P-ring protein FlgI [Fimbriimonadaceae bacterium]QYK57467.1 MAG: flagellar basal body P-ring protein FlgI [Fimbriimonadaceae bacterium]